MLLVPWLSPAGTGVAGALCCPAFLVSCATDDSVGASAYKVLVCSGLVDAAFASWSTLDAERFGSDCYDLFFRPRLFTGVFRVFCWC